MTDPPRGEAIVGAVVLAGGRSARFGRDKLVEPIDGRAMLDHAIDAVRGLGSEVVVVMSSAGAPRPPSAGVRFVADPVAFEGPLAGLATGLHTLDAAVERVIVVGGDMPTLVVPVLDRLLSRLDRHDLAVLADDERARPLPLATHRSVALDVVERLVASGERRLRALLDELDVAVIPSSEWRLDDPAGRTLLDVDTPGDLPA